MELPLDQVLVSDLDVVEAELTDGIPWEVQFDRTLGPEVFVMRFDADGALSESSRGLVATKSYFERLNGLCAGFGEQLAVRFYGHYGEVFDARVLENLPNAHALTVNCLDDACNLEAIAGLKNLSHLSLGARNLTDKAILSRLPVGQLKSLTLEEADTKALDLAPLAEGSNLTTLKIYGHRKNIAALGSLSTLEEFGFNPAKGMSLEFINGMTDLKALKLVLGGTEHLRDIELPNLQDLAVTQTRGFNDFGDLQRFGTLRRVLVQDEPHLKTITTGSGNPELQHVWFHNCPGLGEIAGLEDLPALRSLHASKTGLSDGIIDQLPTTVTHALIMSKGKKGQIGKKHAGLTIGDHPDMPFFYK